MNCDNCDLAFRKNENLTGVDHTNEADKHYTLSINAKTLARLIQRQQLTIADLHCMNSGTKQFIQSVLLQCILCKTVQNQGAAIPLTDKIRASKLT